MRTDLSALARSINKKTTEYLYAQFDNLNLTDDEAIALSMTCTTAIYAAHLSTFLEECVNEWAHEEVFKKVMHDLRGTVREEGAAIDAPD